MVIDCKKVAAEILQSAKDDIDFCGNLICPTGWKPRLVILSVGNDDASAIYLRNKTKVCESVGIEVIHDYFPENVGREEIKDTIEKYNKDTKVHAILLQLPLPKSLKPYEREIINTISPEKDVDGLTAENIGYLNCGMPRREGNPEPCTPAGIMYLLESYLNVCCVGQRAVVIGRSDIVGRPMAAMLMRKHATVTICHSKTENLSEITQTADILICAAGKLKMITADMVKNGAIVIDVGINRDENGNLCGDVDFDNVKDVAKFITKVPGGVGLLTTATLAKNVIGMAIAQSCYEI